MSAQKAIIVTHQALYPYHAILADHLQCALSGLALDSAVLDISANRPDHIYFHSIRDFSPDLLVTLDLAGFRFANEYNEPSYNGLGCIMAHIAIAPLTSFEAYLSHLLSFSMFFFTSSDKEAISVAERFPQLPNLRIMQPLVLNSAADAMHNQTVLTNLFSALLTETAL